MPKIPKKFYFVLLAAFILGAAWFAYQHAPKSIRESWSPGINSGSSVVKDEASGSATPSAVQSSPVVIKRYR